MAPRALLPLVCLALLSPAACEIEPGDPPASDVLPSAVGSGKRIHEISDPTLPTHPANNATVTVTGVNVVTVDNFDETKDGKSRGTIYVEDLNSSAAYSGISLYSPTFIPGDLRVGPGDVLDMTGAYQENASIGSAIFPAGQVLPQIAKPTATFRYEFRAPVPAEINVSDLADYNLGRKWIGMLVTMKDVTLVDAPTDDGKGRVSAHVFPSGGRNAPTMTNELYNMQTTDFAANDHFASITGVVTYFFSLHVAPRSAADIVK